MIDLARAVFANLAGGFLAAVAQLALIPFYLHLLGIEAYGLFGIHATLLLAARFCDLGIGTALNRVVAQAKKDDENQLRMSQVVSTVLLAALVAATLAALTIAALSGWLARKWVHNAALPDTAVAHALAAMGVVVGCQFVQGILNGVLLGAERHLLLNGVRMASVVVGSLGAVVMLLWINRSVEALFAWLAVAAVFQTGVTLVCCNAAVLRGRGWGFFPGAASGLLVGMGGIGGIHLTGLVLGSIDKAILSKLLSLADFGYYMLASTLAGCMALAITPVFNAFFPRLSALAAAGDEHALRGAYHFGSQVVSVLIAPTACTMALFAIPAVHAWTGSAVIAAASGPIVTMLVAGSFINGLMYMPYSLQLARHNHLIGFAVNCGLVVVLVPSLIVLAVEGGARWASAAWLVTNIVYLMVAAPWTHRALLPGAGRRWFGVDVLGPVLAALLPVVLIRCLCSPPASRLGVAVFLCGVVALASLTAAAAAPEVRRRCLALIDRARQG